METGIQSTLLIDESNRQEHSLQAGSGKAWMHVSRYPLPEVEKTEDSAAVFHLGDNTSILAIADGFGGCRGGKQAAEIAIKTLEKYLRNHHSNGNELRTTILDAFEEANKKVLDLGIGAATTFVVVEINKNFARSYHVGDSIVQIVGQRGKLKYQTISHSPVGYAIESGSLEEKEAMHHDERHIVSNMIGASDMRIEIGPRIELSKRDTILLASDGLTDNLHTNEITNIIRSGPVAQALENLAKRASHRMLSENGNTPSKPDDLSIILFRLGK
ncbi:MAG: serine/threonine-protein phosphatase [Deltaproteobacteria bacterium]|nr:serine/threonine-protein phosphatase [Deltaproteobacteria bacterium]